MSKKLSDIKKYIQLFDLYKKMFSESQREYFNLYYFDDLSLTEISDHRKVSRSAVSTELKKIRTELDKIEDAIGFLKFKTKGE